MESQSPIRIRNARPDEQGAIEALTLAAFEQYAEVMPHWEMYHEHLRQTLAQDQVAERIIAERDGVVVGSVLLYPANTVMYAELSNQPAWPELRLLAVAPEGRGQGVGAALLEECIRRARAAGATTIGLHSEDIMGVALQMYLRRGFVRAPQYDFVPAEGVYVKGYRLDLSNSEGAEHSS